MGTAGKTRRGNRRGRRLLSFAFCRLSLSVYFLSFSFVPRSDLFIRYKNKDSEPSTAIYEPVPDESKDEREPALRDWHWPLGPLR